MVETAFGELFQADSRLVKSSITEVYQGQTQRPEGSCCISHNGDDHQLKEPHVSLSPNAVSTVGISLLPLISFLKMELLVTFHGYLCGNLVGEKHIYKVNYKYVLVPWEWGQLKLVHTHIHTGFPLLYINH